MGRRVLSALIHADVDPGLIDGSAVWLASMAELLARAGCSVTVLLRDRRRAETPLLDPLASYPSIRIVEPSERSSRSARPISRRRDAARTTALRLDRADRFDLIVLRGMRVATDMSRAAQVQGRLWTYLTDLPQSVVGLEPTVLADLDAIARASAVVLCQTEELRSYLETIAPASVGRTAVLPPIVPPADPTAPTATDGGATGGTERPLRLVYAGKFAPLWRTLEMTRLPARSAAAGVAVELIAIGDKVDADPGDPTYRDRMQAALADTPGVAWHGGRSRTETMRLAASADVGLGWRDPALDASLELSTKILEYGALDLPVILNRTPMHERLLGRDYPLFASSEDDVLEAIALAATDPSVRTEAGRRMRRAADDHTFERAEARLGSLLDRVFPPPLGVSIPGRPLRVGIASHDLKFFTAILRGLQALPDVEVRVDLWMSLHAQDERASRSLVEWADVIICEWCGPNAVWYSHHVRPGQRLIVRLHRVELDRRWPAEVAIEAVDRVVCVSRAYADLTRAVTGWPAAKVVVIPNWVDDESLDRPKQDGARFHMGFIGMAPSLKRLDRALDVLEWLRADDDRYRLFVKTKLTWDYPWLWRRADERAHVDLLMRRIQTSRLLRGSVVFDDFGPDVASWLRRIGFLLSTSDNESFHLAPAEGMASGAVPAILDWPGADTIYEARWIHRSTDAMARSIAAMVADDSWDEERAVARSQAQTAFGVRAVQAAWDQLIRDVASGSPADGDDEVDGVTDR